MKISTLLDHIDSGHMALPEFQRGYVWNRDQVRGLFGSLYRRHPVGGLLVWATESNKAARRGDGPLIPGVVKLLLDGQQRITSLYGVARGHAPRFFDGNKRAFTGLRFHLESEQFEFYQPKKMDGDALWIDVSELLKGGNAGLSAFVARITTLPEHASKVGEYVARLSHILSILEIGLHVEEVTGADKSLDIVVDIFNRVNSGGTKLSKGDLALAKICADWPEARDRMKAKLKEWASMGYHFNLDWLLRSVNTVLTGEAKFQYLELKTAEDIRDGLERATRHIDTCLNLIAGRIGLDHDRVFFGRFAIPVLVRYLDQRKGVLTAQERDKMVFWFAQAGMWGRYSSSTESFIDKDLAALEGPDGGLDKLIEVLRLWHGGLRVEPGHFNAWSLGARFYPVLYMITRMSEARDWGTGLPLKSSLLGRMNKLEVHHIFPKARLKAQAKAGYTRTEINALGNFCFLTKDTNLDISDGLPAIYFSEVESAHPGALASQWVPLDPELRQLDRFRDFLEARKVLLAAAVNRCMESLLHEDTHLLAPSPFMPVAEIERAWAGSSDGDAEEDELDELNDWLEEQGLPRGELSHELPDVDSGRAVVIDLAWPKGLQQGLSEGVALIINEDAEAVVRVSQAGFKCFRAISEFRSYVEEEVLDARR